jgi:hypothetical protein
MVDPGVPIVEIMDASPVNSLHSKDRQMKTQVNMDKNMLGSRKPVDNSFDMDNISCKSLFDDNLVSSKFYEGLKIISNYCITKHLNDSLKHMNKKRTL